MKIKTNQEAFDYAVSHMWKQKSQSIGLDGTCQYRGPRGKMCIVGAMIEDQYYKREIEGSRASGTLVETALVSSGVYLGSPFLLKMQQVHDLWHDGDLSSLKKRFIDAAKMFELNTDIFEKLGWE